MDYLSFHKDHPSRYQALLKEGKGIRLDSDGNGRWVSWSAWNLWTQRHDAKLGVWDEKETT